MSGRVIGLVRLLGVHGLIISMHRGRVIRDWGKICPRWVMGVVERAGTGIHRMRVYMVLRNPRNRRARFPIPLWLLLV